MKLKFIYIFFVLCFAGLLFSEENAQAPDFEGKTTDGKTLKLSDFKGKVVLLDFWASWCGPCRKEFPYLIELSSKYKDKDFVVLAINIDREDKNCMAFIEKFGGEVPFNIIRDSDGTVPTLFNILTMPTTFIIDKKGIIRYSHKGFLDSYKDLYINEINELLKAE